MTLLPIVLRELSVAARNKSTHRVRVLSVVVGIVLTGWLLIVSAAGLGSGQQGQGLFDGLALIVFHFCLVAGPLLTADSISAEKREGTLGLLFLTDLRGYDIIGGKLVAASVAAAFAVLAIVPVLCVALMLGGVTLADVAREAAVWITTLFASVSTGILISTLSRDDRKAMAGAALAAFAIGYGAYAPAALLEALDQPALSEVARIFSAGFAHSAASEWLKGVRHGQELLASLFVLLLFGTGCLTCASQLLPRVTGERAKSPARQRLENAIHRWAYGEGGTRQTRRAQLLDTNPFLWLASRHQRKRAYMWLFIGSMLVIWCWMTFGIQGLATEWRFNGFVILGLHALIKFWWLSEVAERFVEDRRQGAVELIFTTSATPREFATGQAQALRRTFGGPIAGLLFLELFWLLFAGSTETSSDRALQRLMVLILWAVLAVDLWALTWLSLWNALTRVSAQRASHAAFNTIALWPWLVIIAAASGTWLFVQQVLQQWIHVNTGSAAALLLYGGVSLAMAAVSGLRARRRFLVGFRAVASEGFNPRAAEAALATTPVTRLRLEPVVPAPSARDRRPWLRRHWLVAAGSVPVLILLGGVIGHHWYWSSRVDARVAALRSSGYPTSLAEFRQSLPAPDPTDGGQDLQAALNSVSLPAYRSLDTFEWPERSARLEPARIQALESLLRTNAAIVASLRSAVRHSTATFAVDLSNPTLMTIPKPYSSPRLAHLAVAQGVLRLEARDVPGALEAVHQTLQLASLISQQPTIFSRQAVGQLRGMALDLLEQILARRPLSPPERLRIEAALTAAERPDDVRRALTGLQAQWLELRHGRINAAGFGGLFGRRPTPALDAFAKGCADLLGLTDRELDQQLEQLSAIVEAAAQDDSVALRRAQQALSNPRSQGSFFNLVLGAWFLQGGAHAYVNDRTVATRCRAARLALAADAAHQRTARWPRQAEELTRPENPNAWLNPLSGELLRWDLLPYDAGLSVNLLLSSKNPVSPQPPRQSNLMRSRHRQTEANTFVLERPLSTRRALPP